MSDWDHVLIADGRERSRSFLRPRAVVDLTRRPFFGRSSFAKTFRKRIVSDFEFCNCVILISSDRDKTGVCKVESGEWRRRNSGERAGFDYVHTRAVLVH